jgi:hypothetical protein
MWRKRFKRLAASLGRAGDPAGAAGDGADRGQRARPRRLARAVLKRLLYSPVSLRLFGHMILTVAVKP